jgi:hypothetical protein
MLMDVTHFFFSLMGRHHDTCVCSLLWHKCYIPGSSNINLRVIIINYVDSIIK